MTTRRYVSNEVEHTEFESEQFQKDYALAKDEIFTPSPSCLKCSHCKTCFLFKNEVQMIESQFGMLKEKDRPCKPEDRAKWCNYYMLEEKKDE